MAVSDDEIIKRKLLIEGDGGSDDKKISNLLKSFIKWAQPGKAEEEDSQGTYDRMLGHLAQCEFSMYKSLQVYKMNLKEQENYNALQQQIEENLMGAYEKISACKSELYQAKRVRRNRQEYDALAKVIQQHPDRQDTLRQLEALDKELETMKESKESLERKLELRRKQFHVLITSIHQLQQILDEDEQNEDTEMDMT